MVMSLNIITGMINPMYIKSLGQTERRKIMREVRKGILRLGELTVEGELVPDKI